MKLTKKMIETFKDAILPGDTIEFAIEWIRENLSPSDVFDQSTLCTWAEREHCKNCKGKQT